MMNRLLRRYVKTFIAMLIVSQLFGCLAPVQPKQFDISSNANIKTIGLIVRSPEPSYFVEFHLLDPGIAAGLIAKSMNATRSNNFAKLIKENHVDIIDDMTVLLTDKLQKNNYAVKVLKYQGPFPDDRKFSISKYDTYDQAVDAYLEVVVNMGYYAATDFAPYLPRVTAQVSLSRNDSKSIVYASYLAYGFSSRSEVYTLLALANQSDQYSNYDDLMNHSDRLIPPLKIGCKQIAQRIADDMKK